MRATLPSWSFTFLQSRAVVPCLLDTQDSWNTAPVCAVDWTQETGFSNLPGLLMYRKSMHGKIHGKIFENLSTITTFVSSSGLITQFLV